MADKQKTVFVVDDSAVVLAVVVAILRRADFHVVPFTHGAVALKHAAEYGGHIDLFLSDIQLPGMSGPDLGILKQHRPDMHVMLMSGVGDKNLPVLNYGWSLIRKPFVRRKLLEVIDAVLRFPDGSEEAHQYAPSFA